jgi:putative heme-binding domain-containing protein
MFLRDKGNGTSELRTVTGGWVKPTGIAGSNLDAIGLAVNKAGEVFFGLGCDKWYEAYKVNTNTLQSEYDIRSERGTILRISRDGKTREIIATGLRFPVGMAFNANGDLFCTDQEGATWLPNGNPFDELLHIQPGRHYGFPPRHPKYLPNVIDEPSVFDYAPQHQSTCGIHFNEPVGRSGKVFGPSWWRGDAFVAGESRGKIFRTKLIKTAAGYVAKTDLIACLSMLTLDAVPTPGGDLIVACHSGKPDWGTGPQGKGKLFKISYADTTAPQPVLAYAASPTETRVVFDRVLTGKELAAFDRGAMAMGKYASAGERFESFRPGYQVVNIQRTMPRFELPVAEVRAGADKQSLVFRTDARVQAVNYAITMPASHANEPAAIDLLADLSGAEATWKSSGGGDELSGWLPHLDLSAARGFTPGSEEHAQLFKRLAKRGALTLRAQLDLWNMLRPATQPESRLDFSYPPETVTVVFRGGSKLDLKSDGQVTRVSDKEVRVTADSKENQWLPLQITLTTGGAKPKLDVSWFTAEDSRERPLPLRRILLPWAKPYVAAALAKRVPELDGGDWQRGKKIFFSEQPGCFKCHSIHNEGGSIGADLSNLLYRDYASVLRDITEPSAAINPEHIAYNVELKDGEAQTGVVLENDEQRVTLGLVTGAKINIRKSDVANMKPSSVSLMPEGLLKGLTAEQQRDLLTFLLLAEPKPGN